MLYVSDTSSPLYLQMRQTYNHAIAPGTARNKAIQANQYIRFMLVYDFNYLNPSVAEISMYTQFLANSFSSPATVRNYLSGAKTWVQHHMGNPVSFQSYETANMVKSVVTTSKHVPSQAASLSPTHIKIICSFLDSQPSFPRAVKPCILLSFSSFLRASNMVSPSLTSWGGPHTLQVSDIHYTNGQLVIRVRSTKTLRGGAPSYISIIPSPSSQYCPVRAWLDYKYHINPCPMGPAFVSNLGLPLTSGPVVLAIRMALQQAGHPDPSSFSFHSLRRGGAQAAASLGAPSNDLMSHGLWKTTPGLAAYVPNLPTSPSTVPRCISRSLAN